MSAVLEVPMPRQPRQDAREKATTHVRVFADIAEMIGWIVRVEKKDQRGGSAQLLDPLIRPQIKAKYERYAPIIDRLKALELEARKIEDEAATVVRKPTRRGG